MRARRVRLPTGVALMQVTLPHRRLIYVAHDLDLPMAKLAKDAAAVIGTKRAVVVLTRNDLERALEERSA